MYAHDRTLLANLGFADPDKKNSRHDLACRFLLDHGIAESLIRDRGTVAATFTSNRDESELERQHAAEENRPCRLLWLHSEMEKHLGKGEGKYQTTIGFLDVVYSVFAGKLALPDLEFCIEVKIQPISPSNILRQINLYRQYQGIVDCFLDQRLRSNTAFVWSVAVGFEIDRAFEDDLNHHEIGVIRLGDKFEQWCKQQAALSSIGDPARGTVL